MHTNTLRLAMAAALIGSAVACNPEGIISSSSELITPMQRASLVGTSLQEPWQELPQTAFSNTFVRHAGPADRYSVALDLSRFEGEFILTVTNGDGSGSGRVRAGSLKVDGVELLRNPSFAGPTTTFLFTFADAPAALEIEMLGPPGSSLRVDIQGHPRRWRVCPGESHYRTYPTVQAAVAAADPGATIWVCDGTHYAAARVNKPLTIRPEHSGAAILRDTLAWTPGQPTNGGPAPVFFVNFMTSGTFRVVDFHFVLRQSALAATGAWARVEMDSVRITSVDSAHTVAVRTFPGSAESQLEIKRSSITRVGMGVFANGGTVNVAESAFDRTGQGISTSTQGRVENNTFSSCTVHCIWIREGRGGVTVSGNTIVIPAGPRVGSAVQVQVGSQPGVIQLPIQIENNAITGVASPTPLEFNSWVLQRGVGVFTNSASAPPAAITVVGNRIARVRAAIAVYSINGTVVNAHDNVIDSVFTGLNGDGNPSNPAPINWVMNFRRNDVTNAARPFGPFAGSFTFDGTCNWWGSPAGPANPSWLGSASAYTPWATEPIAARSQINCP